MRTGAVGSKIILADAGYDSEANHRLVREELGAQALIKTGSGRPTSKPPSGPWRRVMKKELEGSQKGRPYGQRSQVETTNSMMKRNLGDSLRSRSAHSRAMEQLLRVVTHNVMLFLLQFRRVETEPLRPPSVPSPFGSRPGPPVVNQHAATLSLSPQAHRLHGITTTSAFYLAQRPPW